MRSISSVRLTTLILVAIAVTFVARFAHAQSTREEGVISAYTEPSKRVKHAFNALGVIDKVEVKEGDPVKSGQVLMLQDAEVEALELERLKAEADSQARVEYAAADLDVKKKIYERKSKAGEGVFPVAEVEEAELAVTAGDKQLEIAKLDSSQNKIKARQQQAKVDRMGLKSKIDGVVEKIDIWEGEMADQSKPAIIVVRNDPSNVKIKDMKHA